MSHSIDLTSMRTYFLSGATLELSTRLKHLERLERLVKQNADSVSEALYQDLRKPKTESLVSEVAFLLEEIRHTRKHLKTWVKPQKKSTPVVLLPAQSQIHFTPRGAVLIIGPWNYPFQLTLAPLVGALAAGNCAVIKPSELTPHTSQLITQLITENFPQELIQVQEGGVPETTSLLQERFDHIFFTGSTPVGKIIMSSASQHLTPVTLELGGKSPAIVCENADLDLAARRIVWGKFYNAGQTCVAPDYVCAHQSIASALVQKIKSQIAAQFGSDPHKSPDLGRILNPRNFQRLAQMIEAKNVALGGQTDEDDLYIAPTLIHPCSWEDQIMEEEIFGPLLPLLEFSDFHSLIHQINQGDHPLAAYLFSSDKSQQDYFTQRLQFGGGCINDTLVHLSHPELPFGGLGASGMGQYHGHSSFLTFSHQKSVMKRYGFADFSARYAPYDEKKLQFLRRVLRF
jgi:aldehyde dehydrogenase (NAD+)